MWETDLGYFGVPNGEQVKKPARSRKPFLDFTTRFGQSHLYVASSVCSVFPILTLTLERVYVHVFRQTMKRRDRGRPVDLECS